jgi:hypothetical protein
VSGPLFKLHGTDQYNIISETDLRKAIEQTSGYLASLPARSSVQVLKPVKDNAI